MVFNKIVSGLTSVFGNKADRDLKKVGPIVEDVNAEFQKLASLSNDELRNQTVVLKEEIKNALSDIDGKIADYRTTIKEAKADDIETKENAYAAIDDLEKERDEALEEILLNLLPRAFAVVKETAKRFTENESLTAQATELDRELATIKPFIKINGDQVTYPKRWEAAGSEIEWNMIHYDVQLIGGWALHQGKIAEMATGEGKTLVSTLPAYLNALGERGVHLITVNDYLARRDCEWNAPIFHFLGLTVDCIDNHRPNSEERRKAYRADITYGTNNEFGFDYLRDNMVNNPDEMVQRKHHFAMIDEVDSVLIDDARTPLIISGPVPKGDIHEFYELKPRIEKLVDAQKKYVTKALSESKKLIAEGKDGEKDGGLLLFRAHRGLPNTKSLIKFLGEPGMKSIMTKAENYYLQDQQKEMHKVDEELYFTIEEKTNQIELTDKGIELITRSGEDPEFFIMPDVGSKMAEIEKQEGDEDELRQQKEQLMQDFSIKSERIHSVNQLLKAYAMFERDVEYIVQEGKVKIVDEQTGRVMDGRRYSDGLHQAIEAKENVKVEASTQTFATITLQNFFRMYHKLSGMTGTAETEAGEFWEIYKLDVMVIPTNRPIQRDDREDLVYKTKREKYNAVIDEIHRLSSEGRPILVGTTSVEVSETLSRMLKLRKVTHNVLNAKQHAREADVVATAGQPGAVTIATNMAGRGTDIKLGAGVKENGGLAIIGTERHDSRRVDRQLRGRAGRQGDPGSSQFFVSMEDDLMRLFNSERVVKIMDRFGYEEGEVIQHPLISRSIERNQKKVEQNNFGIRKRLLEYDDVMNKQRTVIYSRRKNALFGERLSVDINNAMYDWCQDTTLEFKNADDFEGFKYECLRQLAIEPTISQEEFNSLKGENLVQKIFEDVQALYFAKSQRTIEQALPVLTNIYKDRGDQIKNVVIPFTDGVKGVNVATPLEKAIATDGREITSAFERFVALSVVDDHWKEHLRELDDLKQTSSNASIEQKDPLLIYKIESFNLFKDMVAKMNAEILNMLFRGSIPQQNPDDVKEAQERKRTDMSRMKEGRSDATPTGIPQSSQANAQAAARDTRTVNKEPVIADKKVGRNDPCPCGSGLKYKKCHGKTEA